MDLLAAFWELSQTSSPCGQFPSSSSVGRGMGDSGHARCWHFISVFQQETDGSFGIIQRWFPHMVCVGPQRKKGEMRTPGAGDSKAAFSPRSKGQWCDPQLKPRRAGYSAGGGSFQAWTSPAHRVWQWFGLNPKHHAHPALRV